MPALLTGQANVQFDVSLACQMEQRSKLGISVIIFAQWNFKGAILRPCSHESGHFWNRVSFLPGFVWTWFNKPLDVAIESGCKKIVFGEQIHWFPPMGQRADLGEKKIAVSKMSRFVWTGNNSIPEHFSISISIFNILRHLNRLLIRFQ